MSSQQDARAKVLAGLRGDGGDDTEAPSTPVEATLAFVAKRRAPTLLSEEIERLGVANYLLRVLAVFMASTVVWCALVMIFIEDARGVAVQDLRNTKTPLLSGAVQEYLIYKHEDDWRGSIGGGGGGDIKDDDDESLYERRELPFHERLSMREEARIRRARAKRVEEEQKLEEYRRERRRARGLDTSDEDDQWGNARRRRRGQRNNTPYPTAAPLPPISRIEYIDMSTIYHDHHKRQLTRTDGELMGVLLTVWVISCILDIYLYRSFLVVADDPNATGGSEDSGGGGDGDMFLDSGEEHWPYDAKEILQTLAVFRLIGSIILSIG